MSKLTLKELNKLLKHAEYYNNLAPFPVYDTDYVKKLKEKMDEIRKSKADYDEESVDACKYCKNLHIVVDDEDNDICSRCNSVNEIKTYENIHEYLKEKNIWN